MAKSVFNMALWKVRSTPLKRGFTKANTMIYPLKTELLSFHSYNRWLTSCWEWLTASINYKYSPVLGPVMFPVKESLKALSFPFRSALRRSALPCLLNAFNVVFSFSGDMSSALIVENNRQGRTSKTKKYRQCTEKKRKKWMKIEELIDLGWWECISLTMRNDQSNLTQLN